MSENNKKSKEKQADPADLADHPIANSMPLLIL